MFNIFFDLDGTLLDSQAGIIASMQHALAAVGAEEPAAEELRGFIGSSLPHTLANFLGPHGDVLNAINAYRDFYNEEAMFDAEPYDGIGPMFDELLTADVRLFIATTKPHIYATEIVNHFGIGTVIERVFGSELDGTNADKTALLQFALDEMGFDPDQCVMIGDRHMDIAGAKNNDMRSIAALWGYGEADELRNAEPDMLAGDPTEVAEIAFDLMGIETE